MKVARPVWGRERGNTPGFVGAVRRVLIPQKSGTVEQVNALTDVTWHCAGQNTHSIGIMLVGDFSGPGHDGGEPTPEQKRAFFALAKHLMAAMGLPASAFFGHCDFGKLACPGYTAYSWLKSI